ncbi:MAG: hypothetical protein QF733_10585, partial [Phycisphaerales bacterium]|nr:hypothetical protein [Phycisphaerales bacterium]
MLVLHGSPPGYYHDMPGPTLPDLRAAVQRLEAAREQVRRDRRRVWYAIKRDGPGEQWHLVPEDMLPRVREWDWCDRIGRYAVARARIIRANTRMQE